MYGPGLTSVARVEVAARVIQRLSLPEDTVHRVLTPDHAVVVAIHDIR